MGNELDNNPKKKIIKIASIVIIGLVVLLFGLHWINSLPTSFNSGQGQSQVSEQNSAQKPNKAYITGEQVKFIKPMKYVTRRKFMVLAQDYQDRPMGAHIQVSKKQLPTKVRDRYLPDNPVGFKNFSFIFNNHGKKTKTYFYNRGHLVGYQFCGVNDDPRNMITETQYVNQGGLTKMDADNPQGQLYYEERLRHWLDKYAQSRLDYSVVPVYGGSQEVVPRDVYLTFVGYNENKKLVRINIGGKAKYTGQVGHVLLKNYSPFGAINYQTGAVKLYKKLKY